MDYWTTKFDVNVARDSRAQSALEAAGSKVSIVWECETRDAQALAVTLAVRAQDPEGGLVPDAGRIDGIHESGESSSQECAQNFRSLYPAWEQRKIRSGGFGSEVMRVTCAAIAGSPLRNVSCPSSRIAGELLPSRREAAAERLRVGNRVVEKEVAGAPAFRLKGPFRHQRPLRLRGIGDGIRQRANARDAELRVGSGREGDHIVLLRDIGAGRAKVEIRGEEDGFGASVDDVDRAVRAERRIGFVVELDDLDRLPQHPARRVDVVDGKLRAGDRVRVDRLEPPAERHHEPKDGLVGSGRQTPR